MAAIHGPASVAVGDRSPCPRTGVVGGGHWILADLGRTSASPHGGVLFDDGCRIRGVGCDDHRPDGVGLGPAPHTVGDPLPPHRRDRLRPVAPPAQDPARLVSPAAVHGLRRCRPGRGFDSGSHRAPGSGEPLGGSWVDAARPVRHVPAAAPARKLAVGDRVAGRCGGARRRGGAVADETRQSTRRSGGRRTLYRV